MHRLVIASSLLALASSPALANGGPEKCFDKATLAYVDCPRDDLTAVAFAGLGFTDDSLFGFGGGVWAPEGFGSDGVFFRLFAAYGDWDFATAAAPGGEADVTSWGGNLSVGYRFVFDDFAFAPYVGVDVFDRDIDPDIADTGQLDDDVGVIVGARLDSTSQFPWMWAIDGNYSTVNDSYYVEGEVGYDLGGVAIGPHVAALGNEDWNGFRAGGFAKVALSDTVDLKGVAGYQFGEEDDGVVGGNDGETPFGTVSLSVAF